MGQAQDTLFALAEVAVALAGFSAIVVVLKRGAEGRWTAADADRFPAFMIEALTVSDFCFRHQIDMLNSTMLASPFPNTPGERLNGSPAVGQ